MFTQNKTGVAALAAVAGATKPSKTVAVAVSIANFFVSLIISPISDTSPLLIHKHKRVALLEVFGVV